MLSAFLLIGLGFIALAIAIDVYAFSLLLGPYSAQATIDRRVAFRAAGVPFTVGIAMVLASLVQWLPAYPDPWRARWKEEAKRKPRRPLPDIIESKRQPTQPLYHIEQHDIDTMLADDLKRLQAKTRQGK
jgi:hypothetical protein